MDEQTSEEIKKINKKIEEIERKLKSNTSFLERRKLWTNLTILSLLFNIYLGVPIIPSRTRMHINNISRIYRYTSKVAKNIIPKTKQNKEIPFPIDLMRDHDGITTVQSSSSAIFGSMYDPSSWSIVG
ncbi:MAG: hypothetical protein ACMUJM_08970 [bacterium]